MPFKMHKIIFFQEKKIKTICVPTLPKMFRPVTRNTLIYLISPKVNSTSSLVFSELKVFDGVISECTSGHVPASGMLDRRGALA